MAPVIPEASVIVVGAGPNGLAAAIEMARQGLPVGIVEAASTIGGGSRSAELTLPGFVHDVCSAVHPLGAGSPYLSTLPLEKHGLEWICPPLALAHPFDDATAAVLEHSVDASADSLGADGKAWKALMGPIASDWDLLAGDILGPLRLPRHPLILARFGLRAMLPATWLAKLLFTGDRARALFLGLSCHSFLPPDKVPTAAFGLVLGGLAHAVGWPIARGGSQAVVDALAAYFGTLDGWIQTDTEVQSIEDLAGAQAVLLDVTPKQMLRIAGSRFNWLYRKQLQRFRYGPGVFKVDWALSDPIPWRAKECVRAGTVHLCGGPEEILASETTVWRGKHPEKPFVLLAQQSLFDPSRAPQGKHTGWAYCHVPHGSDFDMTERIERQVERFAPGFRDTILGRHTSTASDLESYDANCVGGDINGGAAILTQIFTRPALRLNPYRTSAHGIYVCSASTPPGGGVHGMCGYHAARTAIREQFED